MKRFLVLSLCFFYGCLAYAQDIITKNDGTDIQAKVMEVGQSQVKYKKFSNPDGPLYTIALSDILMITYENGEREMYNTQKKSESNSVYPRGIMTYNPWSGKISVGGETIPREMEEMYFLPDDYQLFRKGKSIDTIGSIAAIVGALPFGWGVGDLIGYGEADGTNLGLLLGGGTVMTAGLVISALGGKKLRKAIAKYNASLALQPEIQFGPTPNGIGLAIVF